MNSYLFLKIIAVDYINDIECEPKEYNKQFKHYTNLPSELMIKEEVQG